MRVLRGEFKGRKLVSFKASHIRPTSDRVKESVFNILGAHIPGARVLDLFSGTGNLTVESLSQGAAEVTAVESHPRSIKIMKENFAHFDVTDKVRIVKSDAIKFLRRFEGEPFNIILIDPPFTKAMADETLKAVAESSVWSNETLIMIESSKHEKIDEAYGDLHAVDTRNYGDKLVSFFKFNGRNS